MDFVYYGLTTRSSYDYTNLFDNNANGLIHDCANKHLSSFVPPWDSTRRGGGALSREYILCM